MKVASKIFIVLGLIVVVAVSWFAVMNAESSYDRQAALIARARGYMYNELYILAVPVLEEAASINTPHTLEVEEQLKHVYLQLLHNSGFTRRYLDLLDRQMRRNDAAPAVFLEAANFHLNRGRLNDAFDVLKDGIERTSYQGLIDLFERERYDFRLGHNRFEYATSFFNSTITVKQDGLWGIAGIDGAIIIPTMYTAVSTFSAGRAIVQTEDNVFAVDRSNNRIAIPNENVYAFGNLAQDRVAFRTSNGWRRATGALTLGALAFDEIGMYANGHAAAQQNGRWGLINTGNDWTIAPQYDGIIMDILGRAYAQNAVFIMENNGVTLFINGQRTPYTFEDAHPFTNTGYAAVRQNGLWGFIDNHGNMVIPPQFENAQSFSQHLAAVFIDGYWGFLSLRGEVVIDPVFLDARGFYNGSAPVLTHQGWRFITLTEFRRAAAGI